MSDLGKAAQAADRGRCSRAVVVLDRRSTLSADAGAGGKPAAVAEPRLPRRHFSARAFLRGRGGNLPEFSRLCERLPRAAWGSGGSDIAPSLRGAAVWDFSPTRCRGATG